jgi:hypothetical protein
MLFGLLVDEKMPPVIGMPSGPHPAVFRTQENADRRNAAVSVKAAVRGVAGLVDGVQVSSA